MEHAALSFEDRPAAHKRLGVVLLVFVCRVVGALLLALPFAMLFGRAVGAFPRGDAVLFEPGGMLFIEAFRRTRDALPPIGAGAALLFVVLAFLGLLPLGAMLGALGAKGRLSAKDIGGFALRPIATFSLLLGVFAVVQGIAFAIVMAIGGAVARRGGFDSRDVDRVKIAFAVVALLVVLVLGVVHDLARAASVRGELGLRASIRASLRAMRRAPLAILGAFASRSLLALVVLAAAVVLGSRIGIDRGGQIALGFLVHQASIAAALFLRASWLAAALVRVDAVLEPKAEVVAEEASPMEDASSSTDEPQSSPPAEPAPEPAPLFSPTDSAEESPIFEAAPVPTNGLDEKVEREDGLGA